MKRLMMLTVVAVGLMGWGTQAQAGYGFPGSFGYGNVYNNGNFYNNRNLGCAPVRPVAPVRSNNFNHNRFNSGFGFGLNWNTGHANNWNTGYFNSWNRPVCR